MLFIVFTEKKIVSLPIIVATGPWNQMKEGGVISLNLISKNTPYKSYPQNLIFHLI